MEMFADYVYRTSKKNHSHICAGFDPNIEDFPKFILNESEQSAKTSDDFIYGSLSTFFKIALEAVGSEVSAIKPNLAFFEQYGLAGLRSLQYLFDLARSLSLPIIADAKRGDIGSTAVAYSRAFLAERTILGKPFRAFAADALTVNPFLGFDTLQPFLEQCRRSGRGLFILAKTSNAGAADLQSTEVCNKIANWIGNNSADFTGSNGWSGLGAVVGATHPETIKSLRGLMQKSYFLVPGMGAQGGSASNVAPAFGKAPDGSICGAIINLSRGLFAEIPEQIESETNLKELFRSRIAGFNQQLNSAVTAS